MSGRIAGISDSRLHMGGVPMAMVRTEDIIREFNLEVVSGIDGIHRAVTTSDISRPGLELAGFFDYYAAERVQLLGKTEIKFTDKLTENERLYRFDTLCAPSTPGIIVTNGQEPPSELLELASMRSIPVMKTQMKTTGFSSRLTYFLENRLAPTTAVHGVLMDIYGVGVLITGESGVGKSETALALIERGHRLVADDCVEIRQVDMDRLVGTAPELLEHLLEIRGLGIINVMTLFGAGAVRPYKRITLTIQLDLYDEKKQYDRLGLDEEKVKIFDTEINKLTIPVRPGRNLAVIIEVAAKNFRLKRMGMNAAEQFADRLSDMVSDNSPLD